MEIIIAVLACTTLMFFILTVYYTLLLEKTKREWEERWANRTVGSVVSSGVTSEGLEVDLEITDQETWNKLEGVVVDGMYVPPIGLYGVRGMRWGFDRTKS